MGARMSQFIVFALAPAFALVVALVVFVVGFLRLPFALAFLILQAFVVLSVACIEKCQHLVGLLML